ncbi:CHAT domain-containing protein [Leptolyngbya sp. ST-U4]|uniref:CHAT domain-containing protein n=1 Tax=Leptolyngbya sp. ST-U4 TaxID=2933912 RepID=UPI003299C5AE
MKILILASNPRKDLNLDHEIRDLKDVIENSRNRQEFEVEDALAVRVEDLQDLLLRHKPQIVHFCGHGSGQQGLVFENDDGGEQWVRAEALSDLFKLFSEHVECILLNACYSEEQANAIVNHINYVIGMNQEIRDDAAIAFAKGFYRALGYDCSIEQAYEFGKNAIQLEISGSSKTRSGGADVARKVEVVDAIQQIAIPEHLKPILKKKPNLILSAKSAIADPQQRLSQENRTAILLDIDKFLKQFIPGKGKSNKNYSPFLATLAMLLACFVGFVLLKDANQSNEQPPVKPPIETPGGELPKNNTNAFEEARALEQEADSLMRTNPLTQTILSQAIDRWEKAIQLLEQAGSSNFPSEEVSSELSEYKNQLLYTEALKFGLSASDLIKQLGEDAGLEEWEAIRQLWLQAIDRLEKIPPTDPNYARARNKIKEYEVGEHNAKLAGPFFTFKQAVEMGTKAAEGVIAAKSKEDWLKVAQLWDQARELMAKVPEQSDHYATAQQRIDEYQFNRRYALKRAEELVNEGL